MAIPLAKKSLKAHTVSVGSTAKKNVSAMPKARKAPIKARIPPKSPAKRQAKALIEEVVISGVVGASSSSRTIRLP